MPASPITKRSVEAAVLDLRHEHEPWEKRRARGKSLRAATPRESHAEWKAPANRPDPVATVLKANIGRRVDLVPLRMGRMAASPFAFYRGSAGLMAADLSHTPATGVRVIMNGDAHVSNFGLSGTPQRDVILDLDDFDEATVGPWEWDLKRLTASVNLCGREIGLSKKERRTAVKRAVSEYRNEVDALASMGVLEVWYLHTYAARANPLLRVDPKSASILQRASLKAQRSDNLALLAKMAEKDGRGKWRFRFSPPVLEKVDDKVRESVIDALNAYAESLLRERRFMLARYQVAAVAHRVVGVGSVGLRAYLVLLFGNGDGDPLFLQVKEAVEPAAAPFVPALPRELEEHPGRRVVVGQRMQQASVDVMLGWTRMDGRSYYVRQMRNMKGSVPLMEMRGEPYNFYAGACGSLLARAHSRGGEAARIAGYCGRSVVLDEALADFAEAYSDQAEKDHAALVQAIRTGKVKAIMGV
jgi:uncharacterized protein (DUF2252 family)